MFRVRFYRFHPDELQKVVRQDRVSFLVWDIGVEANRPSTLKGK